MSNLRSPSRACICILLLVISNPTRGHFKVGFAEEDITPSSGMEMPGGYGKNHNRGAVHDPLKVRAVVFEDGTDSVALVGVDAISISRHIVTAARQRIRSVFDIPVSAVLIGASHTHTGGPIGGIRRGQFDHASDFIRKLAYEESPMEDPAYANKVTDAIVVAVEQAYKKRIAAKASVGRGREENVAFNRRFRMRNGLTWTHPNGFRAYKNRDILEVAGPIDPEVGVIGVWDEQDCFLGCVVHFACHCTNGVPGLSADYVYFLEKTIRSVMGKEAVVVFLNGACGDVTQVNNLSPDNTEFGVRSARFVGTSIAAEALKVLTKAEPGHLLPLKARIKNLTIPRRRPSPRRLQQCLDIVRQGKDSVDSTQWIFAKEIVLLNALVEREPVAQVEVQAIQAGPAVFLANQAELFCQVGLDIKAASPFPYTFVVELANGCIGYVPTEKAFGSDGGGYETRLTLYSNLAVDAGGRITRAIAELARAMKPGSVPRPPQKGPFQGAWSYGNVPPERD